MTGKHHFAPWLTLALLLIPARWAQAQNTILQKINEIKAQSGTYYWNQYTHPDADTAKVNASKWLMIDINEGRDPELTLEEVMPKMKYIKMNRGTLTRMFAYIKKEDVDGVQPREDRPVANPVPEVRPFVPDAFVQRIVRLKDFYAIYNYLKEQKAQGQVLQFGSLKDVDDFSSLDIILFDMQSKELLTLLSGVPQGGSSRINLTTGAPDSLDNYPQDMILVIWYIK